MHQHPEYAPFGPNSATRSSQRSGVTGWMSSATAEDPTRVPRIGVVPPAPRVRFAPAPSGWLHVGGARTALYNWLHARQGGGTFVLRPEDTDADRVTEESLQGILDALRFLGLDWDEGPEVGGPHGPYIQSERLALHQAVAEALLATGVAYEAFETAEELEAARAAGPPVGLQGRPPRPHRRAARRVPCRGARARAAHPHPRRGRDHVHRRRPRRRSRSSGRTSATSSRCARTAPRPTCLANAVDDLAMGINFVARGEDLLSVTPRQLLLYDAAARRRSARPRAGRRPASRRARPTRCRRRSRTCRCWSGADRKPLSKRHGSVAVDEFRRQGFLPEALLNFLALCGWSPGEDRERFDVDELVARFCFDRVSHARGVLRHRQAAVDERRPAARARPGASSPSAMLPADGRAGPAAAEVPRGAAPPRRGLRPAPARALPDPGRRDRPDRLGASSTASTFDPAAVAKWLKPPADVVLDRAAAELRPTSTGPAEAIEAWCTALAEELGTGLGRVMQPLRVAVSGRAVTPPLPQTLAVSTATWS